MPVRFVVALLLILVVTLPTWGQVPPSDLSPTQAVGKWRTPGEAGIKAKEPATGAAQPPVVTAEQNRPTALKVTAGPGVLPSDHGQVWREYDLTPYTSKITTTERPEQAIVDWILRETGTEIWFSEPLGLMSADRRTLRVYHTAEMHKVIADVVDRFVTSEGESQALSMRLLSVGSPSWRGKMHSLLRPIAVQSPGVEAWITTRENAAVLLGELKKRPDCKEHNAPSMAVPNGQSQTISKMKPRPYTRAALVRDPSRPGGEVELAQIDEGFSLQISPLLSADGRTVDAVIKCQIDQVEKLVSVLLEPTSPAGAKQRAQIQIPQLVSWRLNERFRWPTDQVVVLSCGVVASPTTEKSSPLGILAGSGRADAILMIECHGKAGPSPVEPPRGISAAPATRGRY